MNPSITVKIKTSVETAQNRKVCWRLEGANWSRLKEPCHTTSVTRMASRTTPEPNATRLRIGPVRIIGGGRWKVGEGQALPAHKRLGNDHTRGCDEPGRFSEGGA